jgi:hypothetical protein
MILSKTQYKSEKVESAILDIESSIFLKAGARFLLQRGRTEGDSCTRLFLAGLILAKAISKALHRL